MYAESGGGVWSQWHRTGATLSSDSTFPVTVHLPERLTREMQELPAQVPRGAEVLEHGQEFQAGARLLGTLLPVPQELVNSW